MATQRVAAVLLLLVLGVFNLWTIVLALPTVQSSGPQSKPQEITGKREAGAAKSLERPSVQSNNVNVAIVRPSSPSVYPFNGLNGADQQQQQPQHLTGKSTSHINTAEKLKRGLTNFMNHLNPAPYFVPAQEQNSSTGAAGTLQATIVQDSPSAEAVIKGPKRLTRPLGSPLRWGRR